MQQSRWELRKMVRDSCQGQKRISYSVYIDWATLMRRTFGVNVLVCEKCHGLMRIIALIDQPPVIKKILEHLGLPTEPPRPKPARPPPGDEFRQERSNQGSQLELVFDDLDGRDDPNMYAE
jgi:hypothetical protein